MVNAMHEDSYRYRLMFAVNRAAAVSPRCPSPVARRHRRLLRLGRSAQAIDQLVVLTLDHRRHREVELDVLVRIGLQAQRRATVLFRHALRGGILPVVSYLGPAVAGLLTGSFVVETIFGIPGLGRYFVTAASNRDYTMVQGTVIFYAIIVVGLNLVADIITVWLNPKLRFE